MSGPSCEPEHQATVSVSFELAVDAPEHTPHFQQCYRSGEKKRVIDSPSPEHYFHLQYQLLPVGYGEERGRGGVSKSDVVTFGVVSKVYTERDSRVVRCWEEREDNEVENKEEEGRGGDLEEERKETEKISKGRSHFGWRHKHSFVVTQDLLLKLYDHTLEVKLWNTKEKLAPRARFDRPRAFRLPVPKGDSKGGLGRPEKFSFVTQQMERVSHRGQRRAKITKKTSNLSSLSEGESDLDLSDSISEIPHSPTKPAASLDQIPEGETSLLPTDQSVPSMTTNDHSDPLVTDQRNLSTTTGRDTGAPPEDHEAATDMPHYSSMDIGETPLALQGMSQNKIRQMEAEAAERVRVEREGLVVLRLRMADLFAKRDIITTKMDGPIDNLRAFEVGVSLHSPLMPDSLRRVLNPTVFTVQNASYLPTLHLSEQRERCNPVYVKYQFHCLPEHRTAGHAHSRDITWNDSHIVLLGTIDQELLAECLRGPPLVMEVHDRDRCLDGGEPETVFGAERRDELLGTHAFGAGMKVSETVRGLCCPWDSFGMACFNLDDLLDGHHMLQLTTPITTGPRAPPSREDCRVGPHGRELPSPLPPGDYLDSQSYLTITIELSHPLSITPSHPHTITSTTNTASPEVPLTSCPFTRLVYVTSSDDAGLSLVRRILDYVNENNTAALGLTELPKEMLMTALSTYKLTKCQVEGGRCDVVTGFQVRDREVSVLVVEGLRHGAILRLWTQLPRHASQDPGLVKVFYNSCYSFSRRKYGSLDVDLPLISLPHSLSSLTQLPLVYVRGNVTPAALQALLCLTEITRNGLGGMAELVRSGLFPSVEEISALAMQFGILPGEDGLEGNIKHSEGALSGSHTPIPVVREGEGGRRERVKMPLDMTNSDYESVLADRKRHLPIDHINGNITHTRTLSEQSARLSANRRCHRTRRRAQTDTQPIHIYSSQTLNTAVLAKSRMRAKLATSSEHTHQLYTYCQDYQSMTFEPVDTQSENKSQRLASRQKWRTREGFVYPRVPSTRESNTPQHCPNPAHISEPYTDGLLHANTLKPTVDRLHFSWEQRRDDFDRYSCLPKEFGPSLPISIHLAGQRRAAEARLSDELAKREWEKKVVVNDSRFHTYRRGIRTELHAKPGTQLSRLEDILKSPPVKYSLRQDSLRLEPIPPLDVVQNQGHCNSYSNCTSKQTEGEGERCGGGGYQPGQSEKGSLKRDGNVTPLRYQQMHNSSEGWRVKHRHNFRLFYHTHSPLSKRAILSLSPSEKHPPLFTTPSTTQ